MAGPSIKLGPRTVYLDEEPEPNIGPAKAHWSCFRPFIATRGQPLSCWMRAGNCGVTVRASKTLRHRQYPRSWLRGTARAGVAADLGGAAGVGTALHWRRGG